MSTRPSNITIYTVTSGKVATVAYLKPETDTSSTWEWGQYVRIDAEDGNRHYYCHMVEDSPDLTVGQRVFEGHTPIGIMGNTGYSEGPHLHFEVREPYKKWEEGEWKTYWKAINPANTLGIANAKDTYTSSDEPQNPGGGGGTKPGGGGTKPGDGGGSDNEKPGDGGGTKPGGGTNPGDGGGTNPPPTPTGPTDAQMQAARNAVANAQNNVAVAQGQRDAALAYLTQAQTSYNTNMALKQAAEQRVRNTEVKLDALIAKTNREMAETDNWLAGRIESMRSDMRQSVGEFTSWLQEKFEAVSDRILKFESPVTGQPNGLEAAFEDLHDLHRGGALTAAEYDALQLTAAEYDAKQLLAYEYDVKGKEALA